jgi:hypothetical protein
MQALKVLRCPFYLQRRALELLRQPFESLHNLKRAERRCRDPRQIACPLQLVFEA